MNSFGAVGLLAWSETTVLYAGIGSIALGVFLLVVGWIVNGRDIAKEMERIEGRK